MQQAGQETPSKPTIPDEATRLLRARLILEEALETISALGVEMNLASSNTESLSLEDVQLVANGVPNLEENRGWLC